MANAPTIAKEGLKPGKLCGMSSKKCVHFSVGIFNPTLYQEAQERLAKGDLELPARVGYPPRYDYNAELIFNYDSTRQSGADLRMEDGFAVTAKSNFTVPARCFEVIFSRRSRFMLFVNPLYYQKWLPGPAFQFGLQLEHPLQVRQL